MTHFRQSTRSQLPAYQYAYGDKMASGVCMQSASDYSPFGVLLDGRCMQKTRYRYGFGGMEKDDEVKGDGNSYTTEFRQLDPRVGRWLSLDPLLSDFPWQSPYCSFDNNPIYYTDPKGDASGGPGDPEKIPAGNSTNTTSNTTDDILSIRTTIRTTATNRTFNAINQTFTTTTKVTDFVINTDKLTNKTTFSNSTYSYSETKTYEEVAGKKFNPFEIELEGYRNSDQYQKDDATNRWNTEQRLKVQASQFTNPSGSMFEPVTRESLDKSVMTLLPWYNIARGIQDIQEGNNWGWLKIGLELVDAGALVEAGRFLTFSSRMGYGYKIPLGFGHIEMMYRNSSVIGGTILDLKLGSKAFRLDYHSIPSLGYFDPALHFHTNYFGLTKKPHRSFGFSDFGKPLPKKL